MTETPSSPQIMSLCSGLGFLSLQVSVVSQKVVEKRLLVFNTGIEAAFGLILWRAGTDALQRGSHQPLPCSCQLSLVLAAYQDFSSSLPPAVIYESRLEESGASHFAMGWLNGDVTLQQPLKGVSSKIRELGEQCDGQRGEPPPKKLELKSPRKDLGWVRFEMWITQHCWDSAGTSLPSTCLTLVHQQPWHPTCPESKEHFSLPSSQAFSNSCCNNAELPSLCFAV